MSTNRRRFLVTSSMALAGSALGRFRLLAGQPAQSPPATAFTDLRGQVGLFTGRGGTIGWFVSPDGVVVIDSQFPDTAAICLEGLNQRSSKRPIDVLFNTHHHGDHTAGNITFKPVTKKIVAHVKVPELQKAATKPGAEAAQAYADTTFAESWSATLGRETVHARHLGPAHTGGDSVIFFEQANVVHMGDLVFNRLHPYIDKAAGASIAGWITVLERVVKGHEADTLFIFGHAKEGWKVTGDRTDLLFQRDYLSALLDYVRGQIKAGKPREEIVKSTAELRGFPDHGPLIERALAAAYEELTPK
jgi:glyoxylase-like metal-dependent hydrolase (beta-lactamase superfamily II)